MIQSNETGRLEYEKTRVIKSQDDRIMASLRGIRSQRLQKGRFDLCLFALKRLYKSKKICYKEVGYKEVGYEWCELLILNMCI